MVEVAAPVSAGVRRIYILLFFPVFFSVLGDAMQCPLLRRVLKKGWNTCLNMYFPWVLSGAFKIVRHLWSWSAVTAHDVTRLFDVLISRCLHVIGVRVAPSAVLG